MNIHCLLYILFLVHLRIDLQCNLSIFLGLLLIFQIIFPSSPDKFLFWVVLMNPAASLTVLCKFHVLSKSYISEHSCVNHSSFVSLIFDVFVDFFLYLIFNSIPLSSASFRISFVIHTLFYCCSSEANLPFVVDSIASLMLFRSYSIICCGFIVRASINIFCNILLDVIVF